MAKTIMYADEPIHVEWPDTLLRDMLFIPGSNAVEWPREQDPAERVVVRRLLRIGLLALTLLFIAGTGGLTYADAPAVDAGGVLRNVLLSLLGSAALSFLLMSQMLRRYERHQWKTIPEPKQNACRRAYALQRDISAFNARLQALEDGQPREDGCDCSVGPTEEERLALLERLGPVLEEVRQKYS